ncbi:hypothetical protein A0H76_2703 [Hepatospora eriocheir]|uniref:Uncharacterized protein n=1 Tax=Hepatospora eriocheir TaxID=1081669 RepID=A0A1X0QEX4_9MICR|nr:hypothetical protein A0H76_2703 [Hepatospora eriocheir]
MNILLRNKKFKSNISCSVLRDDYRTLLLILHVIFNIKHDGDVMELTTTTTITINIIDFVVPHTASRFRKFKMFVNKFTSYFHIPF